MILRATELLATNEMYSEGRLLPIFRESSDAIISRFVGLLGNINLTITCCLQDETLDRDINKHSFLIKITKELENIYDKPHLKIDTLAKKIAVSERQMYRLFKNVLQVTPAKFLQLYRLEKAFFFISRGEPLGNVAFNVGFSSHSYFSRCFKETFGSTPSEFVNNLSKFERQDIHNDWHKIVN